MAVATRELLKQWFRKGLKPLEIHFHALIDSFWHKEDAIPMSSIDGLNEALNERIDIIPYTAEEMYDAIDNAERKYTVLLSDTDTKEVMLRNCVNDGVDDNGVQYYGWKSQDSNLDLVSYNEIPAVGEPIHYYNNWLQAGIVESLER